MLAFGLTCSALFVLAVLGAGDPLVMVVITPFPAAVGYYWARGQGHRALALIIGVAVVGLANGSLGVALLYAIGAGAGVFYTRGWTFGQVVAAVTGVLVLLTLMIVWGNPQGILENASDMVNTLMRTLAEEGGETAAANARTIEFLRTLDANIRFIGLGILFGGMVLNVTLLTALVSWRLRRAGVTDRVVAGFREARTPDWLVWVAIVAALLWFAEDRWSNEALRILTWNSALALAYIYALNGFSILMYGLRAFEMTGFWFYFPVTAAFLLGGHAISIVGLFDTWWGFRQRIDRVVEARRALRPPDET